MSNSILAIDGGQPVRDRPLPKWPYYSPEEVEKVAEVMRSGAVNYWTGDEGRRFEEEFAQVCQRRHALCVMNGTVALELCLRALGVGTGDEVIVTPRSFIASASVIVAAGAEPVFVDVDRESQNVTVESISTKITEKTKAIMLVHLAGWPCDLDGIAALSRRRGLLLIEDCAQAHGARFGSKPVGSVGDMAAFSFCQDKILSTCGEGGMVVTDDDRLWDAAWSFRDHGKSRARVYVRDAQPGFRWLHDSIGSNFRMTEAQAAVGRIQLSKLRDWVSTRRRNARFLNESLADIDALRLTVPPDEIFHSYYKYYLFLRSERLLKGWTQARVIEAICAEGVSCGSGSCPEIYAERGIAGRGRKYSPLPVAHELGETSLMFDVHPMLSESDIDDTASAIRKVMSKASSKTGSGDF